MDITVHLALIQEAHLPTHCNKIGEYVVVTDPITHGRTTVILVHELVGFKIETSNPAPRPGLAESVTISISTSDGYIWITNTYIFPEGNYAPITPPTQPTPKS